MVGDLVVRNLARGEVVLRVKARISNRRSEGWWRRRPRSRLRLGCRLRL